MVGGREVGSYSQADSARKLPLSKIKRVNEIAKDWTTELNLSSKPVDLLTT